jgi:hypothetical protein
MRETEGSDDGEREMRSGRERTDEGRGRGTAGKREERRSKECVRRGNKDMSKGMMME